MDIAQAKRRENIAEYILYLWQLEDLLRALQFSPEAIFSTLIAPRKDIADEQKHVFLLWYMDIANLLHQEGKDEKGHLEHTLHLIGDLHDLHLQLMKLPVGEHYRRTYARLEPELPRLRAVLGNPGMNDTELCFRALYAAMLYRIKGEGEKSAVADTLEFISPVIAELADMHGKVERGEVDLFKPAVGKYRPTFPRLPYVAMATYGDRETSTGTDLKKGCLFRHPFISSGEKPPSPTHTERLFDLQPHDVIVHVIAVADREIAFAELAHAHLLVKTHCTVAAVYVQLHPAGRGMHRTNIFHSMAEQEFPDAETLKTGQHVDFLQMEQLFGLLLHRKVPARFAVGRGDEPRNPGAHLTPQDFGRIHPLHHVIHLRRGDNFAVSRRKHLVGQTADQSAVGLHSSSDSKHLQRFYGLRRPQFPAERPRNEFPASGRRPAVKINKKSRLCVGFHSFLTGN